jgi:aminopeptidase N
LSKRNIFDIGEVFDRHIYNKGALVIRMLRHYLGESLFWKGIRLYLERHRGDFAESDQLRMAFEDATGKQLSSFFEQWVYQEHHPVLTARYEYQQEHQLLHLTLLQNQGDSLLFSYPLDVHLVVAGQEYSFIAPFKEKENHFYFSVPSRPSRVVLNRRGLLLAEIDLDFPESALMEQLAEDSDAIARIYAAEQLGKKASLSGIQALKKALLQDPFWGVQAAAAESLGALKHPEAFQALCEGISIPHPRARVVVVRALGEYHHPEAFQALQPLFHQDVSYFVEAEAALALGKTKQKEALPLLQKAMEEKPPSFNSVIQIHILKGITALKEEKTIDFVRNYTQAHYPQKIRIAALEALTQLFKEFKVKKDLDFYYDLISTAPFHLRNQAFHALQNLGDPATLPFLQAQEGRELEGRNRRVIRETIHTLLEQKGSDTLALTEELEKIHKENRELRQRLELLEAATLPPKKNEA